MVVEPELPAPDLPLVTDLDDGLSFRPGWEGTALVGGHFSEADPE